MHQSFVTTAPPPTGNSGNDEFSSITPLLKALYCRDLLRIKALLFIRVNSMGYIYVISQAWHLPGGTQKVIALHISPAIPAGGGGAGVTNDWCITLGPSQRYVSCSNKNIREWEENIFSFFSLTKTQQQKY